MGWNRTGTRIFVVGARGFARLYSSLGKLLVRFVGHTERINAGELSPDGARFATASSDRTVRIWNTSSGREEIVLRLQARGASVSWNGDGSRIVTASSDGIARIWDAATGVLEIELPCSDGEILDVAFSPDGKRLAVAGRNGVIRIWRLTTRKPLKPLMLIGHTGIVTNVSWSPDGSLLASSGSPDGVRIWDALLGRELAQRGPTDNLFSVEWNRAGTQLLAASLSAGAVIYDAERDQRSYAELKEFAALYPRYRIVDGRLEAVDGRLEAE